MPLVLIVTYEVFARYLFNAPTIWVFDLTYRLYATNFMLGAAYALHKGTHVDAKEPEDIVRLGIAHSPEGRRVFPGLTVFENLELGATPWQHRNDSIDTDIERVFELFPRLKERRSQLARSMSGGEQQMLAVGRALMGRPKLLLLDEPSLGLAPIVVEQLFDRIADINRLSVTILLVEQNAVMALSVATRGYVLETGEVVLEDSTDRLRDHPRVREAYLGG